VTVEPFTLQDVAAALGANIVLISIALLAALSHPIPDVLAAAAGASITWLFVRSVQVAKSEVEHGR